MEEYRIAAHEKVWYPMGLARVPGGIHLCVTAAGKECRVLFYRTGVEEAVLALSFPQENRKGDVWSMTVLGKNFSGLEYCFEIDGKLFSDPYGKCFTAVRAWGDLENARILQRCPVKFEDFDWENDRLPEIPYEDSVIYRLHSRGFTKHLSSRVKEKGTFRGIQEKIPYFKELGITTVELMPVNEFSEVIMQENGPENPFVVDKPTGKINFWGYAPGYFLAPKAAYSSGKEKSPAKEFKALVKAMHKEGLELIVELFFSGKETPSFALDVVRFWAEEFHVDGVHLVGNAPLEIISRDPFLSRLKLFAPFWEGKSREKRKHLGEYNDSFLVDMRRALKGDEDQLKALAFQVRSNPAEWGVVHYMANTNGFTMMDMVSYDIKHNEENGENNRDGNSYNYSWNCGAEGPTKRKKIVELRKKQLRNAFLLLFLSQGTPLIMAGDEFGNSQSGNNNAYCQDNEVSWLNWNLIKTNQDILEFVKGAIAFRKAHPVFHMPQEPRLMDYLACGFPDMSYHGVRAWCPEFENFRRQLGVFYCGEYGKRPDGTNDDNFYVTYNMHWEPHEFDLPKLPRGERWHVVFHTDKSEVNGMYGKGEEPLVEGKSFVVPPRSIVVFTGMGD